MAILSTPKRTTTAASHSTPVVNKVASVFSSRYRSQVDPLVTKELDGNILPAHHKAFLEHVLGVPLQLAKEWEPALVKLGEHQQVKDCLTGLSTAKDEKARYQPFATLANFVLDEMREAFPLPDTALPDLKFVRNDPTVIKGPVEARTPPRKPDIVLVRKGVADRLAKKKKQNTKSSRVSWTDILCAVEFKVDSEDVPEDAEATGSLGTMSRASGKAHSTPSLPANLRNPPKQTKSASASASRSVTGSRSSSKRKSSASLSADEPPRKKSCSGSRTGSVHTGASGVTHEHFKQLSSYPLEMLSSTRGTREHALSIFVDGDEMQLWFYDRAGAIHSDTRVNFCTDFVAFATIIFACARLDLRQFGLLSAVQFPSMHEVPVSLDGATLALRDDDGQEHIVTLTGDTISSRPGIVGRCSFVCGATCPSIPNAPDIVVKFSFQDITRVSEVDIIKHARDKGVEYLPLVYLSQDFTCLSYGTRGYLIPKEHDKLRYQDRVLRIMVSQRYIPVYKLPSLPDFRCVIRNVFKCMHQLYVEAQVLHRDISYTNIMAQKLSDGSFRGILIDFDLAVRLHRLSAESHLSLHRTGTLPFMALALLTQEAVDHTFRHDVESLFYVLVWISAHFDGQGKDVHKKALLSWQTGSNEDIAGAKVLFVSFESKLDELQLTDFYNPLKKIWLKPFQEIIFFLHSQWLHRLRNSGLPGMTDEKLFDDVSNILKLD